MKGRVTALSEEGQREKKTEQKEKDSLLVLAPQPFFQDRGTPIAVRLLVEELARIGYLVDLLVFHEGDEVEIPGVTLHRIKAPPGCHNIPPSLSLKKIICDLVMLVKAVSMVRKKPYLLIHAVEEAAFIALLFKKFFKIDYVYDMDSSMAMQIVEKYKLLTFLLPVLQFFERMVIKNSVGVAAVCKDLEDIVVAASPDKIVVRLEDITLLGKNNDVEDGGELLCQRYSIDEPIMLYVGNLERYQGIDLLLASFAKVCEQGCAGCLVIIGGSKVHIEQYQEKAKCLGIADRTVFCGPRPVKMLGHFLSQADILLSPRIKGNNTPMKLYSYLDSGKPVIATKVASHTQILTDEISLLVETESTSMAAGMVKLLNDPQMRSYLGKRGHQFVQDNHSLPVFRKKLSHFYRNVMAGFSL